MQLFAEWPLPLQPISPKLSNCQIYVFYSIWMPTDRWLKIYLCINFSKFVEIWLRTSLIILMMLIWFPRFQINIVGAVSLWAHVKVAHMFPLHLNHYDRWRNYMTYRRHAYKIACQRVHCPSYKKLKSKISK